METGLEEAGLEETGLEERGVVLMRQLGFRFRRPVGHHTAAACLIPVLKPGGCLRPDTLLRVNACGRAPASPAVGRLPAAACAAFGRAAFAQALPWWIWPRPGTRRPSSALLREGIRNVPATCR